MKNFSEFRNNSISQEIGICSLGESRLSLLDLPYNEQNKIEPVYTSAFNKSKKERDGFIVKVRGNIYGVIRKVIGK